MAGEGCTGVGLNSGGIFGSKLIDLDFLSSFLMLSEAMGFAAELGHVLVNIF